MPFKQILKDKNICLTKLNDLVCVYKLCQNAAFFDWINSKIQNPEKIKIRSKLIDSYSNAAFYLVFNCTTVLEIKYNIEKNKICNIHGQVTNSDKIGTENNLVVDFKSEVPLILQDILHNSLLIKPVRKLLKENIDFFNSLFTLEEVYDFGLNIVPSDIPDIPYLKEIIKHTDSNTKFYVNDYYLTEQNKNDIQNNLKNWGYNGVVQFINMM
ncbi:AbiH family protein [Streptococcus pneumoniae]|uniref:AbiH family protein n=1 Tax=Streptococcus pseudopneumoniae TaxID=257758 RepID=UPI0015620E17